MPRDGCLFSFSDRLRALYVPGVGQLHFFFATIAGRVRASVRYSAASSMLRHGEPSGTQGWLYKEGRVLRSKHRRFLRLKGTILSNHHAENAPATWEVSVLDCPVRAGAKHNELVIQLPSRRVSLFAENDREFNRWVQALKTASSRSIDDFYRVGELLGEGAFAEVREAFDRDTGEKFAIKTINKAGLDDAQKDGLLREMNIMKSACHPNIVNTYDVFDQKNYLHIVLEFMAGGELFDLISASGAFPEKQAAHAAQGILRGVAYLHAHGIVHGDIKPENVLCKARAWPLQVKLADFGLASFVGEDGVLLPNPNVQRPTGTVGYIAPEIVRRQPYGPPADMWACGVILYIMLSGKAPFYGADDDQVSEMVERHELHFPDDPWRRISDSAQSLVRGLLQASPAKRLSAVGALQHAWFATFSAEVARTASGASGLMPSADERDLAATTPSRANLARRRFRTAVLGIASLIRWRVLSV
ncbi:putative myosin light chain kinase [Porphyridium purpureum]|uniref:Putative myosin light chain kinase n=1 Tax=Porphyridium purpureum TaxID=35688 RepID=A0A5J4YUJ5_PORPP|nr:putative myosin light chain kinase [Porphyridium purpureum]|eukprot:POR4397..scf227_4